MNLTENVSKNSDKVDSLFALQYLSWDTKKISLI